ncbi:MAG: hypothetical protein AAFZ15_08805 [Bacteroidota bacterium]
MKSLLKLFFLALTVFSFQTVSAQTMEKHMDDVTVIQLSQTPGQYETTSLNLEPGKYIFEVTNKNVDKKLGFYLTPTSDAKAQVPNSGLKKLVNTGETARTGVVELTEGEYQYSCPLNPTPHYSLNVSGK